MTRTLALLILALLLGAGPLLAPAAAQDDANPLLDLLATIPTGAVEGGELVTYGDIAAWHAATGIPRVADVAELRALPEDQQGWWMFVMPRQTVIPSVLGIEYLFSEEMRPAYGFDLFGVDRFAALETPPQSVTVVETALDPAAIGAALAATGYESEPISGGTLYRILDDYETALGADLPRVGMLGALNRIAVLDGGTLLIGRATEIVQSALDAQQGALPSLAEDKRFASAADALVSLGEDLGQLVGAIFHNGMVLADPAAAIGAVLEADDLEAVEAAIAAQMAGSVPPYLLAAFGTYLGEGATYLAVGIVLLPGGDATVAADALRDAIEGYVSLVTGAPLDERWAFDRTFVNEDGDLPVAGVVMRVDDPPAPANDAERLNPPVLSWIDLINRRDLGFLVSGYGADD